MEISGTISGRNSHHLASGSSALSGNRALELACAFGLTIPVSGSSFACVLLAPSVDHGRQYPTHPAPPRVAVSIL